MYISFQNLPLTELTLDNEILIYDILYGNDQKRVVFQQQCPKIKSNVQRKFISKDAEAPDAEVPTLSMTAHLQWLLWTCFTFLAMAMSLSDL